MCVYRCVSVQKTIIGYTLIDVIDQISHHHVIRVDYFLEMYKTFPDSTDHVYKRYFDMFALHISACVHNISLPTLTDADLSCRITSSCTGVDCCWDVPLLGTSINAYVLLDPCSLKMSVAVEKWAFNITLFDYQWGKCVCSVEYVLPS
jgi:hypothetical protein